MKKKVLIMVMAMPDGASTCEISAWLGIKYSRAWNLMNILTREGWLEKEKVANEGTFYFPTEKAIHWFEGDMEFNV